MEVEDANNNVVQRFVTVRRAPEPTGALVTRGQVCFCICSVAAACNLCRHGQDCVLPVLEQIANPERISAWCIGEH